VNISREAAFLEKEWISVPAETSVLLLSLVAGCFSAAVLALLLFLLYRLRPRMSEGSDFFRREEKAGLAPRLENGISGPSPTPVFHPGFFLELRSKMEGIRVFPLLENGVTTIGRSEENDIRILDDTVSARHCWIRNREMVFQLEDLASKNGTFLNKVRLETQAVLNPDDVIHVGDTDLVFRTQPGVGTKAKAPSIEGPEN